MAHLQIMKRGWLSIMVRGAHPTLTLNFSRQIGGAEALSQRATAPGRFQENRTIAKLRLLPL
jgi:hypothetical protein